MICKIEEVKNDKFHQPWSLYSFCNYLFYGAKSDIFSLFRNNDVYFSKYDDSITFLSDKIDTIVESEIIDFCLKNNIRMINAPINVIKCLETKTEKYVSSYGKIFEIKKEDDLNGNFKYIEEKEDFRDLCNFIINANEDGFYYSFEQYFNQLYSRFIQNYSRNLTYISNGKIIGHIGTYAESKDYAIVSGFVVDPAERRKGMGTALLKRITYDLNKENKKVFLYCYKKELEPFYRKNSIKEYDYGKLVLKTK